MTSTQEKPQVKEQEEVLIRVVGYDMYGSKQLYPSLTRIKGVSWTIANAICKLLDIPSEKKVSQLTKSEITKIEDFLKDPQVKNFLKNRRQDIETAESKHYIGTNLEMKKDFDIRRLKKIRSYKGIRHTLGQPARGQRTRSHFRKKGQLVSVTKKGARGKKA